MFVDSIRLRLAVWHTLAVATLLATFAAGTWLFLEHTTRARADQSLSDATRAFVEVWDGERQEHAGTPAEAARDAVSEFRYRDRRMLVFDRAGRLLALSDSTALAPTLTVGALADERGPVARLVRDAVPGRIAFATIDGGTGDEIPVRAHAARVAVTGEPFTVVALRSLRSEDETQEAFGTALGITIPLVLILAGIGGYLLARASLAPVAAIARQAQRTSSGNLHERLPVGNPRDELGHLAVVLNGLLERLEHAFAQQQRASEQQRQFMADASHELRTPVAALQSTADVALARPGRDRAELADALEVVRNEGRRLGRVVDDLFLLARADADQVPLHRESLFLEEVLLDCARAARAMADRRRIALVVPLAPEAPCVGDAHLLCRLVMILLDNAIKYTPEGGTVRLLLQQPAVGSPPTLHATDATYAIVVEDTGPGVPPEAREHIFDRFFRGDVARARADGARADDTPADDTPADDTPADGALAVGSTAGAGLGLAIARWIAEAHGGTLRLDATGPAGSRFVVTLPAPDSVLAQRVAPDAGYITRA